MSLLDTIQQHPVLSLFSFGVLFGAARDAIASESPAARTHLAHWRSEAQRRVDATPVPFYPSHEGQEL